MADVSRGSVSSVPDFSFVMVLQRSIMEAQPNPPSFPDIHFLISLIMPKMPLDYVVWVNED